MREHGLRRRKLMIHLLASGLLGAGTSHGAALTDRRPYAPALPSYRIRLPHDHGAHPAFRTEWWYFTGWFTDVGGNSAAQASSLGMGPEKGARPSALDAQSALGIQITFFRTAPASDPANPMRMAPRQLLLAHVAVASRQHGKLIHDQIARRIGLADASLSDVDAAGRFDMRIGRWRLARLANGTWQADIDSGELRLRCEFAPSQAEWLQGEQGFSRKGPAQAQASHYITLPHLESKATLQIKGQPGARQLAGVTWMDHEWSSSVLDERAVGWDWVGLHGDDGSSLMAFRIRGGGKNRPEPGNPATPPEDIWQHAQVRLADGRLQSFAQVRFEPLEQWTSPRTGTVWPVAMRMELDDRIFELRPLMPDQELDSRLSTGTVYWEGAVQVLERSRSTGDTRPWGRGYLELTGYWKPMKL